MCIRDSYQAYADFHDMMDIAEGVYTTFAQKYLGTYELEWMGEKVDLTPGWPRLTMIEAVKKYVGIDFGAISDDAEAVAAAKAVGVELAEAAEKTWGNALYACFDQKVEEQLVQPTFITMYPVEVSPLTKRSPVDPRLTERFEFFICRAEMGNAYSELNDPIDQRERFMKQVEQRERGDDETEMLDEDFLTALEYGMPPTGGMGMGCLLYTSLFTLNKFFENNLNVSETSRKLFVHRNTLVYRLEKIKKLTGLDLREFDDAIIFKVALMVKKYLVSRENRII